MASSPSALLKVELQATGENDATWGDKANDVFSRLEEAIADVAPITITASDVTLTDTQFAENEARKMIIKATGVKTANRNIIVPAREKLYIVDNGTTGAFTLTVKTSGGTGPAIPQGGKAIVYCDGTDVILVVDTTTTVEIVNDTSPQLGASLDANAFFIDFDDERGIRDNNANELLLFSVAASAVNYMRLHNSNAAVPVGLHARGGDTDISIALVPKGAGTIELADFPLSRPELIDYSETVNAIGSIGGGTQDININAGNVVTGTVDTSTTTFTFSNPPASGKAGSFTLILTNGGSQTVNWPGSVDWVGGVAPTLTAAGVDVLTFVTTNGGTTWLGFTGGLDLK